MGFGARTTVDSSSIGARRLAACAIAREAGLLARRRFLDRSSFTVGFKGPQDFITEVDGDVESLIHARIAKVFPLDGFIGEESAGARGGEGQPVWVVDPIDGTANFARGRRISAFRLPACMRARSRSASSTIRCSTSCSRRRPAAEQR